MEQFLRKYSAIPTKFLKDFFFIAKEDYKETDIVIDFTLIKPYVVIDKYN